MPSSLSLASGIVVRPYQPSDREHIRELCCQTGFLGKEIAPVFEDRELFADYLTRYYTDWEAASSFVLEQEGIVKGYLLGSYLVRRQKIFNIYNNFSLFVRGMVRYPRYNQATRDFIHWVLSKAWKEVPAAPRGSAHFHFNILPEAQGLSHAVALMNAYLDYLRQHNVSSVYGQVVTFESRRGAKLFERYGFQVLERKEITKYQKVYAEPVYLTTVFRKL